MSTTVLDYNFVDANLPKQPIHKLHRKDVQKKAGTLNYDWYVQNTGYWCGPTTAQMILEARGIDVTQQTLANQLGTDEDGTDDIQQFPPVFDDYVPDADYFFTHQPDKETLWSQVTNSIDAGYGVAANIVAYTYNHPQGYPNYTIWHYVPIFGYRTVGTTRQIFCADSANFSGVKNWWVPLEQMQSLVSQKGVAPAGIHANLLGLSDSDLAGVAENFRQLGPT